jgi:hypothetical protein
MSFECRYYLNGWCELRSEKCKPGAKGCVLVKAGAIFIGEEKTEAKELEKKPKE